MKKTVLILGLALSVNAGAALTPSGPVSITGQNGTVISGLAIQSATGDCVHIANSTNITIKNSTIGPCGGQGIAVSGGSGIKIYDNYIHPETLSPGCCDHNDGVFMTGTSSPTIQGNVIAYGEANIELLSTTGAQVIGNFLLNPRGPFPRGQNFQCWNHSANMTVINNYTLASTDTTKYLYPENQEDSINFGITDTWLADGNYVTGGHSSAGCGIIADDRADRGTIRNNRLLNTGQCGIGVGSGINQLVVSNKVYNTTPVTGGGNTAIYTWKQYTSTCGPTAVAYNIADEVRSGGVHSGFWDGGGCSTAATGNTTGASADPLLAPPSATFQAPLIPPQPFSCAAISPYTNNLFFPSCLTPAGKESLHGLVVDGR